jgi:hypothetical protein
MLLEGAAAQQKRQRAAWLFLLPEAGVRAAQEDDVTEPQGAKFPGTKAREPRESGNRNAGKKEESHAEKGPRGPRSLR